MAPFTPRLDILPRPQRLLWDELHEVPAGFVMYGGTALALQLGHRQSLDFDFFAPSVIDPMAIHREVPFLAGSRVIQQESSTLSCLVEREGEVKISFFGVPHIRRLERPLALNGGIRLASLLDLAGTKAAVVQQRAEAKDYLDILALLEHGIDLPHALAAAAAIYGQGFNPQITLKALSFFDDGDLHDLPAEKRRLLVEAVRRVDLSEMPVLRPGPQP